MQTQTPSSNFSSSSSSSSSSPSSPSSSSIITHHSNLSSSSSSSSFPSSPSRCLGLNLLVKAIHQVTAGSVIGVPYIQRRIVTRRRRPINFNNLIIKSNFNSKSKPTSKRQRRVNVTMPSKFRDSVLQSLTPKPRSHRSVLINIVGQ